MGRNFLMALMSYYHVKQLCGIDLTGQYLTPTESERRRVLRRDATRYTLCHAVAHHNMLGTLHPLTILTTQNTENLLVVIKLTT